MSDKPEIHVYGVAHHDDTITKRILDAAPEGGAKVYHESLHPYQRNIREALKWRPVQLLRLSASRDASRRVYASECEKAAAELAERYGTDITHVGMLRKKRAKALRYVSTLTIWLHIGLALYILIISTLSGNGIVIHGAILSLMIVTLLAHAEVWDRMEFPVREYHMTNQILNHLPEDDETGVVIVGEDHRESIAEKLEVAETESKDLTR